MYRLEKRPEPSKVMRIASPLLAAVAMLITGFIVFTLLGKDPVQAFYVFFIKPINGRVHIFRTTGTEEAVMSSP